MPITFFFLLMMISTDEDEDDIFNITIRGHDGDNMYLEALHHLNMYQLLMLLPHKKP